MTYLKFEEPVPLAVGDDSAWTVDFKQAIVSSVGGWGREPEALQVVKWMKKLDAEQGKFLEGFTDKELQMWRTHVRNNMQQSPTIQSSVWYLCEICCYWMCPIVGYGILAPIA